MKEIWKPIKGYEGYYEVSSMGRVKSLDRVIPHPHNILKRIDGRIFKEKTDADGYIIATLSKHGKINYAKVHRLVYFTFCSGNEHLMINHMNCNKRDNRLENLEAVTPKENSVHAAKHGLVKCVTRRKIIRSDGKIYPSLTAAAESVGGVPSNMWHVVNGRRKSMKGYGFKYL